MRGCDCFCTRSLACFNFFSPKKGPLMLGYSAIGQVGFPMNGSLMCYSTMGGGGKTFKQKSSKQWENLSSGQAELADAAAAETYLAFPKTQVLHFKQAGLPWAEGADRKHAARELWAHAGEQVLTCLDGLEVQRLWSPFCPPCQDVNSRQFSLSLYFFFFWNNWQEIY